MPVNTTLCAGGWGVGREQVGGETGATAVMSLVSNTEQGELGEWIKPRVCQKVPCPS